MLRFASSPTRDLTINDLHIALVNYIVAKQRGEDLIIRIEDGDTQKNIEKKDQEIVDLLGLFGIEYTQVVYQSQNARFHSAMALQLIHDKKAFSCFCSDEWLEKKKKEAEDANKEYLYDDACRDLPPELVIDNTNPFSIRIMRPTSPISMNDLLMGEMRFSQDNIDSFEIMHRDKRATQLFATAVDDMLSDISLVIRSKDFVEASPKEIYVREMLHYNKQIEYAHIADIHSSETIALKPLLEEGFLPQSIVEYLLGRSLQDAVESFKLENITQKKFTKEELGECNRNYMLQLDAKELSRYVGFADDNIGELAKVYLQNKEITTTKLLKEKIAPIFAPKEVADKNLQESVQRIRTIIKDAPYFEEYEAFKNYIKKESSLESELLEKSLRLLLTGADDDIVLEDIYKHIKNYLGEIIK